jgi:hypothetical protein
MTTVEHAYLQEDELVRRAIAALLRSLGPVEATRFLTLPRRRHVDAVQRHREWQETLDQDVFFDQVFEQD